MMETMGGITAAQRREVPHERAVLQYVCLWKVCLIEMDSSIPPEIRFCF